MTAPGEQVWLRPSPGLWRMRRAEVTSVTVVLALFFGLLFLATLGALAGAISVLVLVALGALWTWFVLRRYRAWRYQERHEDLIVARGVMVQRLSVVPYGRMQFVEVTAGPVERLFHLSTVKLHTAAAASDARIPGLETEEAARLRDRLTELGESMAAGM
jgi:membrane protein YdbS with pleckstrin-like domain